MHINEDYDGHNLVFVIGSPRSGTTWLQRLLATHPEIQTGQESAIFNVNIGPQMRFFYRGLKSKRDTGVGCYFTEEEFLKVMKKLLITFLEPMISPIQQHQFFLEKTPSHAIFIPEIVKLLPKARFIHILRDPRDVVCSLLAASKSWGASWAPKTADQAAKMWVKHVLAAHKTGQNLPNWQYTEIHYDRLQSHPVDTINSCCKFIGLEWSKDDISAAIESNRAGSGNNTTQIKLGGEAAKQSGEIVQEPTDFIRTASSGGWRHELSIRQKYLVWRIVRRKMKEVGFDWPIFFLAK